MVFIIYSSSYDPGSGGNSITHYLCHYINMAYGDGNAYLCPPIQKGIGDFDFFNNSGIKIDKLEDYDEKKFSHFRTNPKLNTTIVPKKILIEKKHIAIYTEGIYGNPLEQKNVVRWILFFAPPEFVKTWSETDMFVFYTFCYYNTYNFFYKEQDILTKMIKKPYTLTIIHYDDVFKNNTDWPKRNGTCYTMRKGSKGFYFPTRGEKNCNLKLIHNLNNSFHFEYESFLTQTDLIKLFNEKQIFYSYDPFTFLNLQAAACGCVSVIVPIEGLSKEKLFENVPHMKYGVAYGLEDVEHSLKTMHNVADHLVNYSNHNIDRVMEFCESAKLFFSSRTGITPYTERICRTKDILSEKYLEFSCPKIKSYELKYPPPEFDQRLGILDGWKNFEDIARDSRKWSPYIPDDVDAILPTDEITRWISTILALHKNIAIITMEKINEYKKTLILTNKIIDYDKTKAVSGHLYVDSETDLWIDMRYKVLPIGVQEWNFRYSSELWENSMIDFDGVLSVDPENHYFENIDDIREFHINAKKYMAPFVKLGCIVSGRRQQFLDSCEEWLRLNKVEYDKIILNPEKKQDLSIHGKFKGEIFKNSNYKYFIESDINQSMEISKISQKPVLCIDDMSVYFLGKKIR